MDKKEFKKFGYNFIDWVADYLENLDEYRVCPSIQPGDIKKQLPPEPPLEGEPMDSLFADFRNIILPGLTHWQHPGWFAYFPANNSPASILAELLTAGIGAQWKSWKKQSATGSGKCWVFPMEWPE